MDKMFNILDKMLHTTLSKTSGILRISILTLRINKTWMKMRINIWLKILKMKISLWIIRSRSRMREWRSLQPTMIMKLITKKTSNLAQTQRKMLTRMIKSIIKINKSCSCSNNCLENSLKVTKKVMKPKMNSSEIILISSRLLDRVGVFQLWRVLIVT